jgi:hypothetical protein
LKNPQRQLLVYTTKKRCKGYASQMSSLENHHILDAPDPKPRKQKYLLLGYVSLALMALGVIMQMLHWPFWMWPVLIGSVGMIVRSVLFFIRKPQRLFAWAYFFGRIALIGGLLVYFFRTTNSKWVFVPAFCFFFIGVVLTMFDKSKEASSSAFAAEEEEEDEDA